ncbi:MAG: PLP-dependent aminotransferase family protein [Sedimenticola sp.]|nr:PLP-dependent aminotransferase family protein [Sedimenticola sp.]
MKKYEQVAQKLSEQIAQGIYKRGDRLPSIRHLSEQMGYSISTIQEAYLLLEQRGFTEVRPKSGHFVTQQQKRLLDLPAMPEYSAKPKETSTWAKVFHILYQAESADVLYLGRAVPNLSVGTLKPLQSSLASLTRKGELRGLSYDYIFGCDELRRQITRLAVDSGCNLSADEVVITSGCQEALASSLRAITSPGDTVIVDSPSFYGSLQAIEACGLKTLELPTHPEYGISLTALELAFEQWPVKACLITPTFNNPLGYTMPDNRKARLIELLNRYDVPLIEDDIYGDLCYEMPRPRSVKSFDTEGRVILCSSFSKTLAPGLRVGWVAPGRYASRVMHMKYISSMSSATLPQLAVADFISRGGYDRHLKKIRGLYKRGRDYLIEWITRYFPEGTRVSHPNGGYLLWVELPAGVDSMQLTKRAMERGVGVAPGELFSSTGKFAHHIRLNYADCPNAKMERGVQILGELVAEMDSGG